MNMLVEKPRHLACMVGRTWTANRSTDPRLAHRRHQLEPELASQAFTREAVPRR